MTDPGNREQTDRQPAAGAAEQSGSSEKIRMRKKTMVEELEEGEVVERNGRFSQRSPRERRPIPKEEKVRLPAMAYLSLSNRNAEAVPTKR